MTSIKVCYPDAMSGQEIDAIRALLTAKPRPVGWGERRERIDEIGSTWPVAPDVRLEEIDLDGVPGEWSIVPGSDAARVLMFFHGGGYCSGSIVSHRRMVTEAGRAARMRTLAVRYRLAPEHPYPAAPGPLYRNSIPNTFAVISRKSAAATAWAASRRRSAS